MSLSRSPSPVPGGGWASPGLNSGRSSPSRAAYNTGGDGNPVVWDSTAKSRHSGYPSFSTQNQGFFTRHMRKLSSSLPRFTPGARPVYVEKDKHARNRLHRFPFLGRLQMILARLSRKSKIRMLIALVIFLCITIFYNSPLIHHYRRSMLGGKGRKYVIILAANVGGGVMEWKGAREWAIERDSTRNKKKYVKNWGYDLEIVDMSTKKRYAHEWRESWEKVDFIRHCLKKYPDAEWFWWLDLNTFIMEPTYSLQSHLFDDLGKHVYRDINVYNPLNISHPPTDAYLDAESRSAVGDGHPSSINFLLSQDCAGFNLGSFFVRRSAWLERLLDVWWDPVAYEQKHMEWAHKEQDALEQLYVAQPWIRKHVAFLPQRKINSFPPGACNTEKKGDEKDKDGANDEDRFHYNQKDRDFVVNMAGCEWGRDCWGEMYNYREVSYYLNRNPWERFKEDLLCMIWFKLTGQKVKF